MRASLDEATSEITVMIRRRQLVHMLTWHEIGFEIRYRAWTPTGEKGIMSDQNG